MVVKHSYSSMNSLTSLKNGESQSMIINKWMNERKIFIAFFISFLFFSAYLLQYSFNNMSIFISYTRYWWMRANSEHYYALMIPAALLTYNLQSYCFFGSLLFEIQPPTITISKTFFRYCLKKTLAENLQYAQNYFALNRTLIVLDSGLSVLPF